VKLTVNVESKTVAGTERGGEDLFLLFTAEADVVGLNLDALEPVLAVGESFDGSPVPRSGAPDEPATVWCSSPTGDFEWRGTEQELLDLVEQHLRLPDNWSVRLGGTTAKFEYEEFVGGNAD